MTDLLSNNNVLNESGGPVAEVLLVRDDVLGVFHSNAESISDILVSQEIDCEKNLCQVMSVIDRAIGLTAINPTLDEIKEGWLQISLLSTLKELENSGIVTRTVGGTWTIV
jgi:hypothetical protein